MGTIIPLPMQCKVFILEGGETYVPNLEPGVAIWFA